jgi:HK97 family phage prohead protease
MNPTKAELQPDPGVLQAHPERALTLSNGRLGLRSQLSVKVTNPGVGEATLDFIASDATLDRYDEVIDPAGWDLTNYRRNPVVVDSHDYGSISRVIGQSLLTEVRDGKLLNRVKFALENPLGKLAHALVREGFIRSESVGFLPLESKRGDPDKGEPRRTYTKQELLEISLVAVPANPAATIGLALKSGALERRDLTDVIEMLRQFSNNESPADNPSDRVRAADWSQLAQRIETIARASRA